MHGEHHSEAFDLNEQINLADSAQVDRWATKLGLTAEHLRELVARVGTRVSDLEQELSRPENLD